MAITINTTCNDCGSVDIDDDELTLTIVDDNPSASHYTFCCPECGTVSSRPADWRVITLLRPTNAHVVHCLSPVVYPGEPFTYDDLLEFHGLLESSDFLVEELTGLPPAGTS